MIFRDDLARKVLAGEKTVTRRACSENPNSPWWIERCRYPEGKDFTVNPGRGKPNIGRARVVRCERMVLGHLSELEAQLEGFDSADAFERGFAQVGARKYDETLIVWRIAFELIPAETFPAPRTRDCAYGCCKAGDVGLSSEAVDVEPTAAMRRGAPRGPVRQGRRR